MLCAERYLVGHDIRGVVELDKNRFGVVTWNENKVYQIDRMRPEAVIHFKLPDEEKNCISMRLIPYYDMY